MAMCFRGEPGVQLLMTSWPHPVRRVRGSEERGSPFATRENLELANETVSARHAVRRTFNIGSFTKLGSPGCERANDRVFLWQHKIGSPACWEMGGVE